MHSLLIASLFYKLLASKQWRAIIILIYMLSQLDQQQLRQLKAVQQKKYEYKKVKDSFMNNQIKLKQQLNKLEVIASIYNSQQYQKLLLSVQENFQDFQALKSKQDCSQKNDQQRLEKLKLSNENLAYMVEDLQRQLQKELMKSHDINQSMKVSQQSIDQLVAKRRDIQRQIQENKANLLTFQVRNKLIRAELSSLIPLLSEEDADLLLKERYQEFTYKCSKHISYNSKAKMQILTDLANKCIIYQSIKNAYEENNQKYTEGCLIEKLQALIVQENQINQLIQETKRNIQREMAEDELLRAKDIRKQAVLQAREHVFSKLQDFSKKKSAVAALLQLYVPGSSSELELQRAQIEKELFFLEQQQKKLLDFLHN